jgi:hypothetical protein
MLRRLGLAGTELAQAQCSTIRTYADIALCCALRHFQAPELAVFRKLCLRSECSLAEIFGHGCSSSTFWNTRTHNNCSFSVRMNRSTQPVPRVGRILMARGRDAADVPIATTFGPNTLESFKVWTDEMQ